ncbi:uncharacterized protein LOC131878846 [Tigriopus californicus]|uniref:uncharacterized protein LOC131878846 n=1 Tax=Tigriopus californicus TaxID=6832 RepID=UPI0027DA29D4|nr:uncharacterized protein LOC131878846 [Tigriopus californicus]
MNIPRQYSSATLSPNGTWIVAGGEDYLRKFRREDNLGFLDSTELLRDQAFDIGPVLPGMMRSHCLTWINNTHLFLTGGMVPSPGKSNRAYLLDTTLYPLAWQPVASMQNTRYSHTCQVVGRDRKQIVITSGFGGGSLVEVFDLDSGTWSTGPELPTTINWYPGSVPYRDSFLLIGGYNYEYMNQLLWLDPSSFSWTKLNQTLKTRRNMFATMLVDDSYCL